MASMHHGAACHASCAPAGRTVAEHRVSCSLHALVYCVGCYQPCFSSAMSDLLHVELLQVGMLAHGALDARLHTDRVAYILQALWLAARSQQPQVCLRMSCPGLCTNLIAAGLRMCHAQPGFHIAWGCQIRKAVARGGPYASSLAPCLAARQIAARCRPGLHLALGWCDPIHPGVSCDHLVQCR